MGYRQRLIAFVSFAALVTACVSDNALPPVSSPTLPPVVPSASVNVIRGESIALPEGLHPMQMTHAAEKYWVLVDEEPIVPDTPGPEDAVLLAIDIDSGEVQSELAVSDYPSHLIADEEALWLAHWGTGAITRVDPGSGSVMATIELELPFDMGSGPDRRLFIPNDLALGHGSLWVSTARGALARIDRDTNDVEIIELEPKAPGEIAIDSTGVWIGENVHGLRHINSETGEMAMISLDQLDHTADQLLVVGDFLYVVGDRLARTEDGAFKMSAGSYVSANEYALSRFDLVRWAVTATSELQYGAWYMGRVEGNPGFVDREANFHELERPPGLLGEIFETSPKNGWPAVEIGEETWLVDNSAGLIRRVRADTSAGFTLPFSIDDETEPRPVSDAARRSADWIELDRGPMEPRRPATAIWTGEEIVIWGGVTMGGGSTLEDGAAYDPATDQWRMMRENPLPGLSDPGWVWTGEELLVWDGRGKAAGWDPDTNTWRVIEDWPLAGWFYRRSVWTGEEVLDVFRDLAVDPKSGKSRPIADSPQLHRRASLVWADGYMVSVTGEGSYHLGSDTWKEMPRSGLTSLAVDGTAIGSRVIAADYEMKASVFDPAANTWSPLPDVPLRFFECGPQVHRFGHRAVVEHCSGVAVLDEGEQTWTPLAYPVGSSMHIPAVIPADEHLYLWGDGLFRTSTGAVDNPRRLMVGTSLLDLPDGWKVTGVAAAEVSAQLTLESSDGRVCVISERHLPAIAHLRRLMRHQPTVTEVQPYVGGAAANALYIAPGEVDEMHHLIWATSTSDVVEVACAGLETLNQLAPRVWSPWQ